ncbi:MAG: sulfate/molybdate ABC transporter ATP-binding protein [Eubacteriaceae bacterium]|jgi:molybdate transport system ATP-binding protein
MSFDISIRRKTGSFTLNVDLKSSSPGTTGLLGASGCGKSMTLKCIAGIIKPDSGHIIVNDRVYFDSDKKINLKSQQRNVGFLFQNYALFPNMTVRDNIRAGIPKDRFSEDGFREQIELFELGGLEDRYPSQLSGGQQQRAALARIFIRNPEILMLDEPFSALDTALRWSLQQKMADILPRYHNSVLFVSHSRDEIYMLCDEAGVMSEGRIVTFGNIQTLFDKPKTRAGLELTGVKNISNISWIDDSHFHANDWNWDFECPRMTGTDCVGIRAHYFVPCSGDAINAIPVEVVTIINEPFASNILFKPKGCNSRRTMCWRVGHEHIEKISEWPEFLSISPDNLLLAENRQQS